MVRLSIGVDDTDSKQGMCTTYVGATILERLRSQGVVPAGFPRLIRLNPNCPYKTRGNCSISLTVQVENNEVEAVKRTVLETVSELAELSCDSTNPGVVFYEGARDVRELQDYSMRVIREIVRLEDAEEVAAEIGADLHKFKHGRGIIGALASIGAPLEDRTYELLAYRIRENWGKKRMIDEESVYTMDKFTFPQTFDNVDAKTGEIRITPHTPCPVLYGVRAQSPAKALEAHAMVRSLERIERFVIYETNQGTDAHLIRTSIKGVRPYTSVITDGWVSVRPRTIVGGHVIFSMSDNSESVDCAAYEPTRMFRDVVSSLIVGDRVRVYGSVKEKPGLPMTVNLEKLELLEAARDIVLKNPACPVCGKCAKSEGSGKGYSCKKCGRKIPNGQKVAFERSRRISTGLYEVPPRARRHLAKPLARMSLLN